MEIRFTTDEEYVDNLKELTGTTKSNQIIEEALALYDWAVKQKQLGKDVYSFNTEGKNVEKIVLPNLSKVKQK